MLCAVYAYKIYCMTGASVSSFEAGEVKVTSSADGAEKAELLWQEYLKECRDIVDNDSPYEDASSSGSEKSFLFGAVRI